MDDIVPGLLQKIQSQFDERTYNSDKLKKALQMLKSKKATYLDVNDFAVEIGEILADVLCSNITAGVLPDGNMYFNIADRLLNPTMQKNFGLITGFAEDVQTDLNNAAGLKLKAQIPGISQDRIDGIVNRISSEADFEKAKWLLDEPIVNFSQSVVDDVIRANATFHAKAGLRPKITRRVSGRACDWCQKLAGTYDYGEEPKDVYRRHERCRCTVDYNPGEGKRQNVWTKAWVDPEKDANLKARMQKGT